MGGGALQFPQQPLLPTIDAATAADAVNDVKEGMEEEQRNSQEESEKLTAAQAVEKEEGGEDSEGEKEDEHQLNNSQIEEAEKKEVETECERPKLAHGYYEIETVFKKRVRKARLAKVANTWEPVKNLLQCSDVIDAFEESLTAGKSRSTRMRKHKTNMTHVHTKKKQHRSPAVATYNMTSHMVRIAEDPLLSPRLNVISCTKNGGETDVSGVNSVKMSKKVSENSMRIVSIKNDERKVQNELDLKFCELKGTTVISMEDTDRVAIISTQEGQLAGGNTLVNELQKADGTNPVQSGRCTGAKKRKSASVKRFKQGPALCSVDDAQNAVVACAAIEPRDVQHPDFLGGNSYPDFTGSNMNFKNKYGNSKSLCTITQIVKPISYKAPISNNVQEVLVAFEAVRSDGTKVAVDNKFLKANNPLLLIDFYEKHLRYSPS